MFSEKLILTVSRSDSLANPINVLKENCSHVMVLTFRLVFVHENNAELKAGAETGGSTI